MKLNIFELQIFSFNSYAYYLTRVFIASTRAFNLLARTFNLPTRAFNLATCAFSLLTHGFELVTHGFELVTRVLLFHPPNPKKIQDRTHNFINIRKSKIIAALYKTRSTLKTVVRVKSINRIV